MALDITFAASAAIDRGAAQSSIVLGQLIRYRSLKFEPIRQQSFDVFLSLIDRNHK
ncbi:hypothetical protein [Methylobacterium sp. A54F]